MALLIRNGEIVTAGRRYVADIWCEGETITGIGQFPEAAPGATVIDAAGKLVFTGFVDPHVHAYLPYSGIFGKDDFSTASRAALIGGTTCFIDFATPARGDDPLPAVRTLRGLLVDQLAAGRAAYELGRFVDLNHVGLVGILPLFQRLVAVEEHALIISPPAAAAKPQTAAARPAGRESGRGHTWPGSAATARREKPLTFTPAWPNVSPAIAG